MKFNEFSNELKKLGLSLCWDVNKEFISVGNPNFANPIIWFNPRIEKSDYTGSVTVKSINAPLFTGEQIRRALQLVDELLMTQLKDREVG